MSSARFVIAGLIGALAVLPAAYADEHEHKTYGPQLEGFDYPYEVHRFQFTSQGADLSMAYMDVIPQQPNGRTAVLLHGRNFCAATWETSLKVLSGAGYRVIAPDQIGFANRASHLTTSSASSSSPPTPMRWSNLSASPAPPISGIRSGV